MDFTRAPRPVRQIQLTSLIDVTFLLLKFFILTSSFAVIESLDVSLPAEVTRTQEVDASMATIDLLANGMVYVNNKPASEVQMGGTIRAIFKGKPDRKVLIRCDEHAVIQQLVDIMDSIHLAGGSKVSVVKRSNQTLNSGVKGG
ncbi:MAG: biopolymer transporter ExbD [Rickettsiales bacterium]|nr:biopolymer transporter ExbD [Rickettsiales bacterium]